LDAIRLVRDLVNLPANDLGPIALGEAARAVAEAQNAVCLITVGDELIRSNYPAVYAVGRAAAEARALSIFVGATRPIRRLSWSARELRLIPAGWI